MFTEIEALAVRDRNARTLREVRANRLANRMKCSGAKSAEMARKPRGSWLGLFIAVPERR